jgi:hypothetical protein
MEENRGDVASVARSRFGDFPSKIEKILVTREMDGTDRRNSKRNQI